jgi:hypothetical protein
MEILGLFCIIACVPLLLSLAGCLVASLVMGLSSADLLGAGLGRSCSLPPT